MFNLMNIGALPYKVISVILILMGLFFWHTTQVNLKVQQAQSAVRFELTQEYNKRTIELKDQSNKVQTELQSTVTKQQKEHNDKIHNLNLRITDLSNSLSHRPERPPGTSSIPISPPNAACTTGCTGQGLYQDDAKFLGWFSGQAEELKEGLVQCYKQYDTVKETLNKFKVDNTPK
jgi:hypothetical protein